MAELPIGDEWVEGNEDDVTIIQQCYCPNCSGKNGVTTMLPTRVPFFREIIIMTLICEDCGFKNTEVSFGGEIQPRGELLTLTVNDAHDLNRQIIKSDSATLFIPEIELEIPPTTQRGTTSTLEGVLKRAASNLQELQPDRLRVGDVDNFNRCEKVIQQLLRYAGETVEDDEHDDRVQEGDEKDKKSVYPFHIILDDPAGNSFIENTHAPRPDPNITSKKYFRAPTQDMALGLQPSQAAIEEGTIEDSNPNHKNVANVAKPTLDVGIGRLDSRRDDVDNRVAVGREEAMTFPTSCPHCHKPSETTMCVTDIPHFKEVIIMSMLCDHCGFKSNEIKGGGAIPLYGTKITLSVSSQEDLGREVLKSDTAGLSIPEIEMELNEGGMDGFYTTVEGLIGKIRDRLEASNPFGGGDAAWKQHLTNDGGGFSQPDPRHQKYLDFLQNLKEMHEGKRLPFTIIMTDPLSNSFVGPVPKDALELALRAERDGNNSCYQEYVDSGMEIEQYERSHEANEELGLNDMKTENYIANGIDGSAQYYGTDTMDDIPDRLRRVDVRGPDHPHKVGKAPVDNDYTIMGAGSANFAVPSIGMMGKLPTTIATPTEQSKLEHEHANGKT